MRGASAEDESSAVSSLASTNFHGATTRPLASSLSPWSAFTRIFVAVLLDPATFFLPGCVVATADATLYTNTNVSIYMFIYLYK